MSVALRGNLQDFGIAEVFQLIGQQRKTGVLEFSDRDDRVQLCFDRGSVVSAAPVSSRPHAALGEMLVRCGRLTREQLVELHRESEPAAQTLPQLAVARGWVSERALEEIEDLLTRETIFRILRWDQGSFDFSAREVEHRRALEGLLGAEQILMDGLRMVDEWQSFADQVPDEEIVFQRCGRFDDYREARQNEPRQQIAEAERVFHLVDGRLGARRVIDLSLLGTFGATRILADLRRAGLIEPLDPEGMRRLRRRRRVPVLRGAPIRGWIAATIPLALLIGLVVAIHAQTSEAPAFRGFAIEHPSLDAIREASSARGAQLALEAYRFQLGHWPDDVSRLEGRGLLPPELAAPAGRPYYYVRNDHGVRLLAPER